MRILLVSIALALPVMGQFTSTATRVVRGIGVPTGSCAGTSDVGKVYARSDAAATNATFYVCSNTASSTYAWELAAGNRMTLPYGCAVGDPAGSALSTGVLCYITVPMAGTITGWDIIVDSGTATVDVWKVATGTAKPTVSNTITASAKPAISTGTVIHSTTMTGWCGTGTCPVAANDILGLNLDTTSGPKYITVNVQIAH